MRSWVRSGIRARCRRRRAWWMSSTHVKELWITLAVLAWVAVVATGLFCKTPRARAVRTVSRTRERHAVQQLYAYMPKLRSLPPVTAEPRVLTTQSRGTRARAARAPHCGTFRLLTHMSERFARAARFWGLHGHGLCVLCDNQLFLRNQSHRVDILRAHRPTWPSRSSAGSLQIFVLVLVLAYTFPSTTNRIEFPGRRKGGVASGRPAISCNRSSRVVGNSPRKHRNTFPMPSSIMKSQPNRTPTDAREATHFGSRRSRAPVSVNVSRDLVTPRSPPPVQIPLSLPWDPAGNLRNVQSTARPSASASSAFPEATAAFFEGSSIAPDIVQIF